jgi:hypothetical protein
MEDDNQKNPTVRPWSERYREEIVTPDEPLNSQGKPYSQRYTASTVQDLVRKRDEANRAAEYSQLYAEVRLQTIAQFLRSVPELSESTEGRIQKLSRQLVKTLAPVNGIVRKQWAVKEKQGLDALLQRKEASEAEPSTDKGSLSR